MFYFNLKRPRISHMNHFLIRAIRANFGGSRHLFQKKLGFCGHTIWQSCQVNVIFMILGHSRHFIVYHISLTRTTKVFCWHFEPPQGPDISAKMSYLTILCGHHVNYVIYGHNMLKGSHYDIKSRNKPQFCSNPENTENVI